MDMPGAPVLQVQQLSKLYARREQPTRKRLAAHLVRGFFGGAPPEIDNPIKHEFWALRDVSFELKRGEAMGVIGLNGSGKTTLLRILAGQILPDRGEVRVAGASAAMIDLQAGFQPAASGRRNIFLRAAALGFTRRQTIAMLDEIIAFSELEEAIDAPMNTYSSGMKMRLAFAVMAMVQPDILFIDEVLAVGDFRFRQKCLARVREMREQSAFVFVSHSMNDVSRFCDRAMVLHKGRVAFMGEPDKAIAFYRTLEPSSEPQSVTAKAPLPGAVNRREMIEDVRFQWTGLSDSREAMENQPLGFQVSFTLRHTPRNLIVGVPIYDADGEIITGFATDAHGVTLRARAGERVTVEMFAPNAVLNPGRYPAAIGITDGGEFLYMDHLPELIVRSNGRKTWGSTTIPCTWHYSADAPVDA